MAAVAVKERGTDKFSQAIRFLQDKYYYQII